MFTRRTVGLFCVWLCSFQGWSFHMFLTWGMCRWSVMLPLTSWQSQWTSARWVHLRSSWISNLLNPVPCASYPSTTTTSHSHHHHPTLSTTSCTFSHPHHAPSPHTLTATIPHSYHYLPTPPSLPPPHTLTTTSSHSRCHLLTTISSHPHHHLLTLSLPPPLPPRTLLTLLLPSCLPSLLHLLHTLTATPPPA